MAQPPAGRIQKVLANAGLGSRRQIESWVRAGRITVNGETASIGQPIGATDTVAIDGKRVRFVTSTLRRLIAYHKPVGEICTRSDPERRTTVFENLPALKSGRWIGVGRLDINSSGLLLFTTDGKLADALMHPSHRVVREYRVRVLGEVSAPALTRLRRGVDLEDGKARFDSIEVTNKRGSNKWYVCRLHEGRNREVRRLFEAVGCQVNRLVRTRYGPVRLPRDLRAGQHVELGERDKQAVYRAAGLAA